MKILPAIDLYQGNCVRLSQGAFDNISFYQTDPFLQIQLFESFNINWVHIVDLDGAKMGEPQQYQLIRDLIQDSPQLKIQVGGGIRTQTDLNLYLNYGVTRVVVGSFALQNPTTFKTWLKQEDPDKLVLACDIRYQNDIPMISIQGWQQQSEKSLWHFLDDFVEAGLKHVLCTDISRDGMLTGPNFILYQELQTRYPNLIFQASGGIASLSDVELLDKQGLQYAILGKSLYENKIALSDLTKWF